MPSDSSDNRRTPTVKNYNHHGAPTPEPEHLPCPRCDSTNTKFCYYNNYNFSQPRHFCKSCRRYWTQGGTLRDIPVGGGSRKNAKRPRISAATSFNDSLVSSGLEYRSMLPSNVTTPVLMSFAGGHGGAPPCGSFTSLLSSTGFFGTEVCGFDQDVGYGGGRTVWPFSGGVVGGNPGGGSTWQLETGDGGRDFKS